MHKLRKALRTAGILLLLTGCATSRTVMIDTQSDIVRLGPDVKGHVWFFRDGKWQLSGDKVALPEGWYAGPMKAQ